MGGGGPNARREQAHADPRVRPPPLLGRLARLTSNVTYVLPVSDDGGSTAEIVRVLGGPAVGDIRSRCLRLADVADPEAAAVAALLGHRLHAADASAARAEWDGVVDGTHALWRGVSDPYKHVIRSFLVHFHTQVLLADATPPFSFRGGSVGNFFFAGARTFFRSLEAAAFLFCRVARAPEGAAVLPAVATEGRLALGAVLEDGSVVVGQHSISHPARAGAVDPSEVDKATAGSASAPLPSPVSRVFYAPADAVAPGSGAVAEAAPAANPRTLAALARADAVVYGMGSLYTSIAPCCVLPGVGEAVREVQGAKILLLNGGPDRETARAPRGVDSGEEDGGADGPATPMAASDVVAALVDALERRPARGAAARADASPYVTAVLAPAGGRVVLDVDALAALGVHRTAVVASRAGPGGASFFDPDALVDAVAAEVAAAALRV